MTLSSGRFLQLLKAQLFSLCVAILVVTSVLSSGFQVLHLAPHPLLGPDITLLWHASYVVQQVINFFLSFKVSLLHKLPVSENPILNMSSTICGEGLEPGLVLSSSV